MKITAFILAAVFGLMPIATGSPLSPGEAAGKVDSLFVYASSGEVMYLDKVQPAIDSIAAMGADAVPRLIEKYDTPDARERNAINTILVKIGKPAVPNLVSSLNLANSEQVARICGTLGEIKDSSAVSGLLKVCGHRDWRVRSESVAALGLIGDKKGQMAVRKALSDSVEIVRKSAAVATGRIGITEALPQLVHLLADSFYGTRMCASEALVKFGVAAVPFIADSLGSADPLVGNLGCTTLGQIGGDTVATILEGQLQAKDPLRRALAAEAVMLSNSPLACGYIELLKPHETDSTVLFYMNKALEKYAAR